jgi:hypothetical protein
VIPVRAIERASALGAASVLAALLATSRPASAQPEPPRTPALDAATERFDAGKRLFREGTREHDPSKLERAYYEFKAAHAIYPGRGTVLNLAEAELATGRALDAMKHVREYVRSFGVPEAHSDYARAFEAQRDAASKATGHIEIVAPPSMRVAVDGQDQALVTPLADAVDVTAGHHVIELVGAETLRREVDAGAGSMTVVTFASTFAAPATRAPTPAPDAQPPAEPSTPAVTALPATPLPADEPPFWTPTRFWGAVVGTAGVIALGTGAVFAVRANQDGDRAASIASGLGPSGCAIAQPQGCRDLQSARNAQSLDHALNLVFVGVGAAAVVSGAAMMLWPEHSQHRTALVPAFWARGGGLELRGEM